MTTTESGLFQVEKEELISGSEAVGIACALADVDVAINAIPTQFIRRVWAKLASELPEGVPIGCVAKGIEIETQLLPTQILEESIGKDHATCVLSGPTIATELVRRQPAVMVASSSDDSIAIQMQELFDVPWLRIYTHTYTT